MQFYSLEFQAFRTLLKELIRIEESENTFDSTWNINDTLDEIYPMFHKIITIQHTWIKIWDQI